MPVAVLVVLARARLGLGGDRARHAAADPAVHGAGRAPATRERMDAQVRSLQRLGGHFLDVVAGLPTLKVFGRAKAAGRRRSRRVSDALPRARAGHAADRVPVLARARAAGDAVDGAGRGRDRPAAARAAALGFETALFVLVLAPEAYLPLRRLGESYHAGAEGAAAASADPRRARRAAARTRDAHGRPDPRRADRGRGRAGHAPRDACSTALSLTRRAGRGRGHQPAPAAAGSRRCCACCSGSSAARGQRARRRRRPARARPRRPGTRGWPGCRSARTCSPGTIADNVRLGRPDASPEAVWRALADARLADAVAALPDGLETRLGERGAGLSAGERQRLALARAFLRDAPLLLLDEPTAGLDGATEAEVVRAIRRLVRGRTVVLVAHRPALLALADRVVDARRRAEVAA